MTTALTGVFDLGETPEDSELLNILKRQTMVAVRTNTIGKVLSFDPASSTATIEVQIPRIERDPNDPTRNITKPPFIIKNMPVVFPRSQQGFLTFPISPGDTGEILVQDRDPSKWLQSGAVVDPVSRFTHNLSFGVFHPSIQPDTTIQSNGPIDMTNTVLDGQIGILLGQNATLKLINEQLLVCLDAFANAVPVPNDGGAAIQTSFKTAYLLVKDLMTTTKVKAE